MTKNKIIKIGLIILVIGIVSAASVALYLFNMPHRNVQATDTDYKVSAHDIVTEYLNNYDLANDKYLDEEGESKVFEVTGKVAAITEDYNHQKVVLLKADDDNAGVSCTFMSETNSQVASLSIGQTISVKGVIRSGATYDEDLELYEDVILEKCAIPTKQ